MLIAFDKDDRVLKFETTERRPRETVRSHAIKWMERESLDIPKPPQEFVALEVPKGQAVLYIYRPGGWRDVLHYCQPVVSIDGKIVDEIHRGGYIGQVLRSGTHWVYVDPCPIPDESYGPIKVVGKCQFRALSDTTNYMEVRIPWPWGELRPELTMRSAEDAMPVLKDLKPTW